MLYQLSYARGRTHYIAPAPQYPERSLRCGLAVRYDIAMNLQTFLGDLIAFGNTVVIPLLFALAFLFFIWNATRYFIIGGANPEEQKKAKSLALWGIIAFVLMVSIWGIVNLLIAGLNLDNYHSPLCPDFLRIGTCAGIT